MNVRSILLSALLALTAVGESKPNVIFILCDDLGWGDLGCFYQNGRSSTQKFATPNLDTFATEGMQLRRHYCPAPVCAPSRASLLAGVHQGHANVRDNQFDKELKNNHTLGTVMKQAGYATAAIGKWGLQGSGLPAPGRPQLRGFDYFFGYLEHGDAHYHYPKETGANIYDGTTEITAGLDKCYSTDLIAARAKKWIIDQHTASSSTPFFIYLALTAPHARLDVPTQAYPSGKGVSGGIQWTGTPGAMINTANGTINSWIHPDHASQSAWPEHAKRYATMVRRVDDAVADLIQTLKDLSIDNDTMIVFTSDNGPANESGSGGSYTYNPTYFDSFGPMDGIKRDCWEGGMREPALVRWPGHVPAGSITNVASQFHDWMPTLAEIAQVPAPARTDGVSLLPLLTGGSRTRESNIYVEYSYSGATPSYTEFETTRRGATRNQEQVIHLDGYKGIRYNITSANDDFQIYDTLNDPKEITNLAGSGTFFTTLQQKMKDRVLQVRRPDNSAARPYDSAPVPAVKLPATEPGLVYQAFEGDYPWVPDFTTLTPVESGTCTGIDLSVRTRQENTGLLHDGYLQIPADGIYTFHLTSNNGRAFLRLHDMQLIDADFGYNGGTLSTTVPLKAGLHPIHLSSIHGTGSTPTITLEWEGPGVSRQTVPAANLRHETAAASSPPTAVPDKASTSMATPVSIPVLANDLDDGTPAALTISAVTNPAGGNVTINGSLITYTPRAGTSGGDSFQYTITDGQDSSTATVTIDVVRPAGDSLWLPLDETSGTSTSEAGGAAIGTLSGFPANPWVPGKLGNALSFDGVDDRVILTGKKGVIGTAARTVCFWINASASQTSGTRPTLVSWGAGNSTNVGARFDINLNHTSGYQLRAEFNSSGVNFNTTARSDLRGAGWVHCAIVVPAGATVSQVRAYLDGVPASATLEPSSSGGAAINTASSYDINLGRIADGTAARNFAGVMDDVRIYPAELTQAEIAMLVSMDPNTIQRNQWHYRHTGNAFPNASNWAEDMDHDGWSAYTEYALGGNPTHHTTGIAPVLTFESNVWSFSFNRRNTGIAPESYVVETSGNLSTDTWFPAGTAIVTNDPAPEGFVRVSAVLPAPWAGTIFARLKIVY